MRLNPNKLVVAIAVVILAALAIHGGYRLEIGAGGLKLENNAVSLAGNN
jgi:hypothetical protein